MSTTLENIQSPEEGEELWAEGGDEIYILRVTEEELEEDCCGGGGRR